MIYLTWAKSVPKGYLCHVLRREMRGRNPCPLHTHDFSEVFWIEQGEGLHLINDRKIPVGRGALVFMRASDRHGFRMSNENSFTVLNVAFTQDTLHFLRERYFPAETRFFWTSTELPHQLTVPLKQLRSLTRWAEYVAKQPDTILRVERFLLDMLSEFAAAAPAHQPDTCPSWLRDAMERIRDPRHFALGTREFARLADRSPEHLTRELRKHFNLTATDIVNRGRMEHASIQLRMTNKEIIQIGLECGFQNLGHFYQIFHHHFGMAPKAYRLRHQTLVR